MKQLYIKYLFLFFYINLPTFIDEEPNIPYYFLGFILAAYMGVPVLGVAMIGVILVLVKFNFLDKQAVTEAEAVQGVSDDDDF